MTMTKAPSREKVLQKLGFSQVEKFWQSDWEQSVSNWRNLFDSAFIHSNLANSCRTLDIASEICASLKQTLKTIAETEHLARLAWHCYYSIFLVDNSPDNPAPWPENFPDEKGETALLYAVVLLTGFPLCQKRDKTLGISPAITKDTFSDLELWINNYAAQNKFFGLEEINWLRLHFSGRLYRLGRLQFEITTFKLDFHAYFAKKSRHFVILCGKNMKFRQDGQFFNADGKETTTEIWTADLAKEKKYILGHKISKQGSAQKEQLRLPKNDYEECLQQGDPVLFVHIPAIGPLRQRECLESLHWATKFFPKHFSKFKFLAFTTCSWLLDYQLSAKLVSESNIAKFQQLFHPLPLPGANEIQSMAIVFGKRAQALQELPGKTSLQKVMREHMLAGGCWRNAAGLIFPEEILSRLDEGK